MAVDPNIKKKADDIRNKIYGKEVRESLASGLEAMSSDVVENEGRQSVVEGRQDSVESQWQSVSDEMTDKDVISAPEIIAARNGEANLKTRLDEEHQEVTAQLAQTESKVSTIDESKNRELISRRRPQRPMIAIVDDDGRNQLVSRWEPILNEKDFKIDVAVITGWVGNSGFLSWSELERLKDNYNVDLVNHTHTHPYLAYETEEEVRAEFENSTRILRGRGHSWDIMVYPFGSHSVKVREIAREFCRAGVHIDGEINTPPMDTYRLARYPLIPGSGAMEPLETYTQQIDEAIEKNGFLVFMSHSQYEGFDSDKIKAIIDYANSKDIEWVHLKEGLDRMGNLLDVGSYSERGAGVTAPPYSVMDSNGDFYSNRYDWINMYPSNHFDETNSANDFPEGYTSSLFFGSSHNFPVSSGELITRINQENQGYSTQIIIHANSTRVFMRKSDVSGEWGEFEQITGAEAGARVGQRFIKRVTGTVPANGILQLEFEQAGISNNVDNLVAMPQSGLETGLIFNAYINTVNSVRVRIYNTRDSDVSTDRDWRFDIIKG